MAARVSTALDHVACAGDRRATVDRAGAAAQQPPPGARHPARKDGDRRSRPASGPASASPTASPTCRATGRTPSPTTTTGPIRKAACRAILDATDRRRSRAASARRAASAIRRMARCRSSRGRARCSRSSLAYFHNPIKPEYIEPLARCAPAGVPKSFTWHGYEIRQYPGYVLFLFNSGTRDHSSRRQAAPAGQHQALERGFARPLGRQHAGRRRRQQQRQGAPRPHRRVRQRERAHRRALHLRHRRQAIQLRRHGHRSHRVHAAVDRDDSGRAATRSRMRPDGWHYEVELANRPTASTPHDRALRAHLRREQRTVRQRRGRLRRQVSRKRSCPRLLCTRRADRGIRRSASAIAESRYAYPVIEGMHLIGLSISVGLIFITDLRLMDLS